MTYKIIQIQDICSKVCSGGTPSTRVPEYYENGVIPWIKTKEVNNSNIYDAETYITKEALSKSSAKLIPENSVIIAMYGNGDTAGRVAINKIPVATNQACCNLIVDETKADYRFVYYYLRTQYQKLVDLKNGGAQQNLNAGILKEYPFPDIPVYEQSLIADKIESFDLKLELNSQINQALEQIAQAIFKSWFVDFEPVKAKIAAREALLADNPTAEQIEQAEQQAAIKAISNAGDAVPFEQLQTLADLFPNQLVESELGEIPEGWEVTRFKPIVEKYIDNRGKTPPTTDNGIPLLEVKHLPENSPYPEESTDKFVDDATYDSWFRAHLEPDDVIISTVGTIGRICLMPKQSKLAIAQNLLGLRFKREQVSPLFMYYQMDNFRFRHDVDARLVVTVQASIKRKDLETIDLLKPSIAVQNAFDQIVKPLLQKQLPAENKNLEYLRDALLPKLLSGQIELTNREVT